MKRNWLYAGLLTLALAALGYYFLPHPSRHQAEVKAPPTTSEASEPVDAAIHPVPEARTDVVMEVLESIIVERANISGEREMPVEAGPILITEGPVEHMQPMPRPDGAQSHMPYADESQITTDEPPLGNSESQEMPEQPTSVDPHRTSCPYTGRCPQPHVSYRMPQR